MNAEVAEALDDDRTVVWRLLQLYHYDFSEFDTVSSFGCYTIRSSLPQEPDAERRVTPCGGPLNTWPERRVREVLMVRTVVQMAQQVTYDVVQARRVMGRSGL
jgi:hypothetical protein